MKEQEQHTITRIKEQKQPNITKVTETTYTEGTGTTYYYYKQEYDKGTFYYQDEGTGTTYCEDCVDYMDAVPKYTYDDSIIIGDVVYALQYEGFCQQVCRVTFFSEI